MSDFKCQECGSEKIYSKDFCVNCYKKNWRKKNYGKIRERDKKYRSENKEKRKAQDKAGRGIGSIKIEGNCRICNERKAVHRHHPNYSKPRDVLLVCAKCHRKIHSDSPSKDVLDEGLADEPSEIGYSGGSIPSSDTDVCVYCERDVTHHCEKPKEVDVDIIIENKDRMYKKLRELDDVKITDFNRDMTHEERQYYGEEFDENR